MAVGLSRREQWALIGVVALILAGLGVQAWRRDREPNIVYVPGQGRWEKLADFKAGQTPQPLKPPDGHAAATAPIIRPGGRGPQPTPPLALPSPTARLALPSPASTPGQLPSPSPTTGPGAHTPTGGDAGATVPATDAALDLNTASADELERPCRGLARPRRARSSRRARGWAVFPPLTNSTPSKGSDRNCWSASGRMCVWDPWDPRLSIQINRAQIR